MEGFGKTVSFPQSYEEETYLWAVARYIEKNPVRANIVKKAEDYPWSSAKAHTLKIRDKILPGENWLEKGEYKAYCEFLRHEDKQIEDFVRKSTLTGRPLGSEWFIKGLERILQRDIFTKKVGRPRKKR